MVDDLFVFFPDQRFNFQCQIQMSVCRLNSSGRPLQVKFKLLVVQQLVDGIAHLVIGELVRMQSHAEACFVQPLCVVELVHEVGQYDHRLQQIPLGNQFIFKVQNTHFSVNEGFGDAVVASVSDHQVHEWNDFGLRQEAIAPHIWRQVIFRVSSALREDVLVVGFTEGFNQPFHQGKVNRPQRTHRHIDQLSTEFAAKSVVQKQIGRAHV